MKQRRLLRFVLILVAAAIVLPMVAGAVFLARFDPNSLKPQITEAVKRATGRELQLNGSIGLKFALSPTLRVEDVAFANPPGFSRPQIATIRGLELQVAVLPLLSNRFEIDRLVLDRPDILLETDAAGKPNWQLTPEAASGSPVTATPNAAQPSAPGSSVAEGPAAGTASGSAANAKHGAQTIVSVDTVRIENGVVAYRDGKTGMVTTLALPSLEAKAASPDAPVHVDANVAYNGFPFGLTADTGSLTRLQDPAATSPWPLKLVLASAGASLGAEGVIARPMLGQGYDMTVSGRIPDLTALAPLLQGFVPPPLHDVDFSAKLADQAGALPAISALTLHAGAADLNAQVPGLTLDRLDVSAADAGQPVKAAAAGKLAGVALAFTATTGPLAQFLPGTAAQPFPVDAALQAAGATLTAKGAIADARALTGVNIALAAQIPDLAALSPLARQPLPALKQVAFQATMTDAAGGLRDGAALHAMSLTSPDGDVSGELAAGLGARRSATAVLKSNRIDLDAIEAAIDQAPAADAVPGKPAANAPADSAPAPKPASTKRGDRLFSGEKLPFDLLRMADADIKADIGVLRSGGEDYKAIDIHAVLADGKLNVDPLSAITPGGALRGSVSVDASQPAPPVHVVLHAPALALRTLLVLAHQPSVASGNLEVNADLHGTGESAHAIAASLDGTLAMTLAGGTIDNRLLGSMLGKVMDTLNGLNLVGKGGSSELRCFATRMEARNGIASIDPLALSSSLLTMSGSGEINLGAETLSMQLKPQAKLLGSAVVIPMRLSGPIRNPAVAVDKIGTAESNAGTVAGAVIGNATPLGIAGGLLGADKLLGIGGSADMCPAALALARGQKPPAEAQAAPAGQPGQTKPPNAAAILKNLFR